MEAAGLGRLSGAGKVDVQLVSGGYFPVLGVSAFAGRLIGPGDNVAGRANPVAAIGYRR